MRRTVSLRGVTLAAAAGFCFLLVVSFAGALPVPAQQPPSKFEIERARSMLGVVKADLKKNYYDPGYRGMDLEANWWYLSTATRVRPPNFWREWCS